MEYIVNNKKYHFSYSELQDKYWEFRNASDEEFFSNIPELLHFVVFVAWFKEIGTNVLLADDGLLHELIHMLNGVETVECKDEIREMFNNLMRL